MMSLQPFSLPPRRLPLRLVLGGLIAGALVLLAGPRGISISLGAWDLGLRILSSLIVLIIGLLLALCLAVMAGMGARRLGPRVEQFVGLLARALACVPVVVLAWGFIAGWIGHLGLPVESLMPGQFPDAQAGWQTLLARHTWELLAPALVLALSLCGEMTHAIIQDGGSVMDLGLSLRARGVPAGSQLWRHHLSQLVPLLRVRLQSLILLAPVYLIIIEDTLQFTGWGGWMAQCLRTGDAAGIAWGFASAGVMLALLCAGAELLRGRLKSSGGWGAMLAWQPWLLWALGVLALLPASLLMWLTLWLAVLLAGAATWYQAWLHIEKELPLDAARVLGAPEMMIWRHHIAVVQCRMLLAWICTVFAQTLLGLAAACALQPRLIGELNEQIARFLRPLAVVSLQDAAHTLADPTLLLQSGGGIALAALCLIQLGRIVQPRLH
jgi:ABC-type dipeptide/oligopeptide/nickel transport system permease component